MIGKTILHYKILEKLGEGGMGVVYKAGDTKLKRNVAIKFLPKHIAANEEERERFKIEAQAAAALNHPNIATIHAIEEDNDEMFIVMEYIEGSELKDIINIPLNHPSRGELTESPFEGGARRAGDVLPIDVIINYATQIAEGLQAAHRKGIVHRDIKSSNIMITEDGKIKIMDFGLAKVWGGAQVTVKGTTLGTIAYMSPEQTKGSDIDHRSDIWSFGIVLYEMLTDQLPFKGDYEQAVIYSILNEDPPPIFDVRSDVPNQLHNILAKTLQKEVHARYQSIAEALIDLKKLSGNSLGKIAGKDEKQIPVIAVLPFENISPDKDADYFADGLAEELIVNLTKIKEMRVVPRTTSVRYKNTEKNVKTVGRELGATFVMTGSVRKFQDNLRISVQLIDTSHETQQWAETYKGTLADVFDIQEKVSRQIADALMITLTPKEQQVLKKQPTVNPEAFDLYLKARDFLSKGTKNNVEFSIQLFQKAIELDSRFAGAHAGLGEAYASIFNRFERTEIWLDKAIDSSLKAITYDSQCAEAYAALALSYYGKKQYDEAFTAGEKAIELDENNPISHWVLARIYVSRGRDKEAIPLYQKVIELNPDYCFAYTDLRHSYLTTGQKKKAAEILKVSLQAFDRYLSQHPDDARAYMFYSDDLISAGRIEEAKEQAAKAIQINPTDPIMLFNVACFYALLKESDLAIESLKKAIDTGFQDYEWIKHDIALDNVRNDPRYITLMKDK